MAITIIINNNENQLTKDIWAYFSLYIFYIGFAGELRGSTGSFYQETHWTRQARVGLLSWRSGKERVWPLMFQDLTSSWINSKIILTLALEYLKLYLILLIII